VQGRGRAHVARVCGCCVKEARNEVKNSTHDHRRHCSIRYRSFGFEACQPRIELILLTFSTSTSSRASPLQVVTRTWWHSWAWCLPSILAVGVSQLRLEQQQHHLGHYGVVRLTLWCRNMRAYKRSSNSCNRVRSVSPRASVRTYHCAYSRSMQLILLAPHLTSNTITARASSSWSSWRSPTIRRPIPHPR